MSVSYVVETVCRKGHKDIPAGGVYDIALSTYERARDSRLYTTVRFVKVVRGARIVLKISETRKARKELYEGGREDSQPEALGDDDI